MAAKRANTSRRSGSTTSKVASAKRPAPKRAAGKTAVKAAPRTASKAVSNTAKKKVGKPGQSLGARAGQKVVQKAGQKTGRKAAQKAGRRPAQKPAKRLAVAAKAPVKVAAPARKVSAPAKQPKAAVASVANEVLKVVEGALDEMKAVQVKVLDVRKLTDIADTLIIASGNSDRHVRSIADRVLEHAKKAGFRPTGVEGQRDGEWVLVDLHDVIVHIMLPRVREIYRLENLWDVSAARREAAMDKVAVGG